LTRHRKLLRESGIRLPVFQGSKMSAKNNPGVEKHFDTGVSGANDTDLEIQTETFRFRKRFCDSGWFKNRGEMAVFSIDSVEPSRSTTVPLASQRDQNPAVSLRTCSPPAVSVKSKSSDRRVFRLSRSRSLPLLETQRRYW